MVCFIKDVKVLLKVKEDFEFSWYLFFQQIAVFGDTAERKRGCDGQGGASSFSVSSSNLIFIAGGNGGPKEDHLAMKKSTIDGDR